LIRPYYHKAGWNKAMGNMPTCDVKDGEWY
jgi:hypothetical protein